MQQYIATHIIIGKYNLDDIDLLLATGENMKLKKNAFVIKETLDDTEISRIKNAVLYNYQDVVHKSIQISDLFYSSLYFHDSNKNYLEIIRKYALLLEEKEYAKKGFVDSVIGRNTMRPYANIDCMVIIILINQSIMMKKE